MEKSQGRRYHFKEGSPRTVRRLESSGQRPDVGTEATLRVPEEPRAEACLCAEGSPCVEGM